MKIVIIAALLSVVPAAARSQTKYAPDTREDDVQARIGFELSKKATKGFNICWEEELRLKGALREVDRIHSTFGVTYRAAGFFRVGAAYTFIARNHDGKKSTGYGKYWDLRHRARVDLLFTLRAGKWGFSFRERPQFTFRTDSVNVREKSRVEAVLRHRFKVEYDIFHLPLTPYVSVELSNTLNAPELAGNYLEKVRSVAGLEWRLDKRSTLDMYYRFDYVFGRDIDIKKNNPDNVTVTPEHGYYHIFGVFYSYRF